MYGRIHYENESGESGTVNLTVRVVDCETRADYERELQDGCRWVESARNEFRNLWGEILNPVKFHIHNPRPMPSPLWDLTRAAR
jgi:hypothetical protein